ncbi:MAG: DUF805 domain-containing protein [Candidatus Competibacteraceae bacterium]|nr:DUF805 domain-containing protein [Candidatus Competibacteraceae bacterium]MCP5125276.1 DUF805 domain-containing protein [Gammaproteobacteria bacterium]HRX71579.1 DUF805 domain-containing protein [Candidatus Competibacteraceae bacterium]
MNNPSPYEPPRSAIKPPTSEEFSEIKIFSAQGRIGRVRYIGYLVGLGLLTYLITVLLGLAAGLLKDYPIMRLIMSGLILFATLLSIAVTILLAIQRLHDFNASSWWSILTLIPLVNLVLMIIPGSQGPNRFGNPPPPNTLGVILLALIMPLIMVIGVIAAIAIPAYMDYTKRAQEATSSSVPLPQ